MKQEEIGKKIFDTLKKWEKQESDTEFIQKRIKVIEEELKGLNKELDNLYENRYKYTDYAVKNHKYWANKDEDYLIRIGDINRIEFFVTNKEEKDSRCFSSSLGILYHDVFPITKEKYEELYKKLTENETLR